MKLNSYISLPTDADDENFFKKASKWILFYVIHTLLPFLLPITLAIQERNHSGGADFLTSKQISIFPSSFLKKAAADLKKAKVNAGAAVNSSVNMRFFSAWKNSKTLPGFFLASGFSQFVRWNMHLYIGQNSAVGEELIYENKALIMNGTFDE